MRTKTKFADRPSLPAAFADLVRLLPPMAIKDDSHHRNTVEMIDRLMRIERLSKGQADYLETLVELAEAYEAKRHSIDVDNLGGARMLRHILNESGLSASDLARLLGMHPTMGSKILQGTRRLTWTHAKILADRFRVAPALFMD